MRDGQPYFIKGAGGGRKLDELRDAGANSLRTWGAGPDLAALLDQAHAKGLSVTIGIWLNKQGQGMDYADPDQLSKQLESAREDVRRYRHHPALLLWGIGNEMEIGGNPDLVFRQVERIAKMVKEEDPNHPTMTVVADMWPEKMAALLKHCRSIDILGVNSYGGLPTLAERMRPWPRPYVLTEWSFVAHGDVRKTEWGSPFEPSSTEKARQARENYRKAILAHPDRVLGAYAFYWGQSQTQTASWFDVFLRTGQKLEIVDALTDAWGGRRPKNRAPRIELLDSPAGQRLPPGVPLAFRFQASDPDRDALDVRYEITLDDSSKRFVGDFEKTMPVAASGTVRPNQTVPAPLDPGPYRLLLIADDRRGGAATASFPFWVEHPKP